MLISEQKYTNKNRLYYRGLADNDKSVKFYKETYLTTRLIYALTYSFGLNGIVEVYRLKDTANIFNMRSKTDEGRLGKFCQEHKMSKYLKYFEILKNNDWLHVLGEDRQNLINAIKSMGYDEKEAFEPYRRPNLYKNTPSATSVTSSEDGPLATKFNSCLSRMER